MNFTAVPKQCISDEFSTSELALNLTQTIASAPNCSAYSIILSVAYSLDSIIIFVYSVSSPPIIFLNPCVKSLIASFDCTLFPFTNPSIS